MNADTPGDALAQLREELAACRQANKALQQRLAAEAPEASQALLDALPAHVAVLDAEGTILEVNQAWQQFAAAQGGKLRGSIGANYLTVCAQAQSAAPEAAAGAGLRAVLAGERDQVTLTYPCPTSSAKRWFEMHVRPVAGGGAVVSHFDVTDAVRIRQKLQRSQDMLERTERIGRIGGWQLDLRTGAHEWSDQTFRLHDLDPAEDPQPTPKEALDYYSPEARATVEAASREAIRNRASFQVEVPLITATGRVRQVRTQGEVVFEGEEAVRLRGIIQDITARHAAEEALAQKEELLRSITSNLSEGVYRSRPKTGLEYVNRAFVEMFGFDSAAELLAADSSTLYADEDARDDLLRRERERNALSSVDVQLRRKDGSVFWGRISSTVIRKDDGSIDYFDGAIIDVTDQKQFEQELIEAKEEAEQMNRLKTAFLANMSHEIRTPLTSIIGFSEVLEERASEDDDGIAGLIRKNGKRLMDTLNSVLDLAQLESGSFRPALERVDVTDHAAQAADLFAETAAEKGITLQLDVPDEPLYVQADPSALDRVLVNLVSNACKFTPEGHVAVRAAAADGEVHLQVVDSGIGIPEQAQEVIFDEFEQVSSGLSRHFEGTGLGLAITRKLVDLMDGRIWVESTPQEGSTFVVALPRSEAETAD
ncbi:MAG: PAS domain S-box protein [Bacteroidetes bacterium]|jgi:PAS domain S-box-containing protein|nr:PAS domain S-box protein [Bacteroidota bacterium]